MNATDPEARPSIAARVAGLAFASLPLVPLIAGLGAALDQRPPAPDCFEYCEPLQGYGTLALWIGGLGILMAVLVWRRHVAAMALALFVAALASLLLGIGLVGLVAGGGLQALANPPLLGITAWFAIVDLTLIAAMRVEMQRAGDLAVKQT